ncbi:MAG: SCO family protein [Bacteroidia bacterium]|nr:SCO family protein [Bacteroidia bacterium]
MKKKLEVGKLLAILILPIGLLLFVHFFGEQHFERLQIVGSKTPVSNPDGSVDTVYHTVYDAYPDFAFPTQTGETLTWDSLRGHVFLADVFFTRCPGICPKLSASMSSLVEYFRDQPEIRFLSISVDPENDTIQALRAYADKYDAPDKRWFFITGDKEKLYKLAHEAFFFKALEDENGELGFVHDNVIMLVDREGRIRKGEKFYDGTNRKDMELLSDEVKLLLMEYESN